jgi:hypothetical protein
MDSSTDFEEQLRKLAKLRDEGILSEQEFQAKKNAVLGFTADRGSVATPQTAKPNGPTNELSTRTNAWLGVAAILIVLGLIFAITELAGHGKSIVGVYRLTWLGYGNIANSKTFDFRSDHTFVWTPYVTSYGGYIGGDILERPITQADTRSQSGTWAVENGTIVLQTDGAVFAKFTQEGDDLIAQPSGTRFVRIR